MAEPGDPTGPGVGTARPARQAGLFTVDQAVNSLSNFGLAVGGAAVASSRQEFGTVAIALSVYVITLNAVRAFSAEVLTVEWSRSRPEERSRLVADLSLLVVLTAIAIGVLALTIALLSGSSPRVWVALALALPLMLVQDLARWLALVRGVPERALFLDSVWAVVSLAGLAAVAVSTAGVEGAATAVFGWWALGGVLSGIGAAKEVRRAATGAREGGRLLSGVVRRRALAQSYLFEYVVGRGAAEFVFLWTAAVLGAAALGDLRTAQAVFGPLGIVVAGLQGFAVKDAAETGSMETRPWKYGALTGAISLVYGVVAVSVFSISTVRGLSPTVAAAAGLVPLLAVRRVALGAGVGPWVALRAGRHVAAGRRARVLTGATTLAGGGVGLALGSTRTVAAGLMVATLASLAVYVQTMKAVDHGA